MCIEGAPQETDIYVRYGLQGSEQVGSQADAGNLSFSMLRKMEELLDRHAAYRTQRSVS